MEWETMGHNYPENMTLTRTQLARSWRYQRKHYHSKPHPNVKNAHDRNLVCLLRALDSHGIHPSRRKDTLYAIDEQKQTT